MAALQDAWEGQPDLSLPAFLTMLQHRGMTWGTTESELLALLDELRSTHPALIDTPPAVPTLLVTAEPRLSVTLTRAEGEPCVVVRSAEDPQRMPSLWRYSSLRPTGPGRPLVITDNEELEHRLGVVELATAFNPESAPALEGLRRDEVGSARWLLTLADGRRAVLGQRLRVWSVEGRTTSVETVSWESVVTLEPEMTVAPAGGGKPRVLGPVSQVVLLEA
nr:hypothetical protein [Corynebacterium stercoris]